jgi:8-oxo-dGTP pyrophosphatase MutT (NUDIX family)
MSADQLTLGGNPRTTGRPGNVLLTRQFRLPAYINGHPDGMLIDAPAGLLEGERAQESIRREAEEETGVRVGEVERIFEAQRHGL